MQQLIIPLTIVFVCLLQTLSAQYSHYSTQQFGARASLLGGAVIGGIEDNSAIYYNPAALSFINTSTLSINSNAYKYEEIRHKDGAGTGLDLKSQRASIYAQMASGMLTKKADAKLKIGFGVFTRQQGNIDVNERHEAYYDVVQNVSGSEYYVGAIELSHIMSDTWFGIGMGYKFNEHLSIGLTPFVSYLNHRYDVSIFTRASYAQDSMANVSAYSRHDAVRLNNIKMLFKGGLHARWEHWRLGLTVTSPSLSFWGESRVQREISFTNLPNIPNALLIDQQRRLPTHYKYPLTIGLGAIYQNKKFIIALSVEYFNPIRFYQMVEAAPAEVIFPTSLSNGPIDFLSITNYANPVTNASIGFEQQLSERLFLHLGFRTDFSYWHTPPKDATPDNSNEIPDFTKNVFLTPNLDLYHASAGFSIQRKTSRISVGTNFTFGYRAQVRQLVNLTSPQLNQLLQGHPHMGAYLVTHAYTLLVGYTYFFAR